MRFNSRRRSRRESFRLKPSNREPSQRLRRTMSWNNEKTSKQLTVRWIFRTIKIPLQETNYSSSYREKIDLHLLMNQNYWIILEKSDNQNSNSRNTKFSLLIKIFCRSTGCPIEALMEKPKPVVSETYDFEYRDKPETKAPLEFWLHPDFAAKKLTEWIFNQFLFSRCSLSG